MKKIYDRIMWAPDEPVATTTEDVVVEPVVESVVEPVVNELQSEIDELFEPSVEIEPPVVELTIPVTEPVSKPEPVTVVTEPVIQPPSEVDELRSTVERLRGEIEKLSSPKPAEPVSVAEPVQVPSPPQLTPAALNLVEMFKDKDLTEVMDTKEGFLGFLQEVIVAQDAITRQQVLSEIPKLVTPVIDVHTQQRRTAEKFYEKHPALANIKSYVSTVAVEVGKLNPDKTLEEVLDLTAETVKSTLGIKDVVEAVPPKKKDPALPGATGGVRTKPTSTNTLQDEIDEL